MQNQHFASKLKILFEHLFAEKTHGEQRQSRKMIKKLNPEILHARNNQELEHVFIEKIKAPRNILCLRLSAVANPVKLK